MSGDGPSDQRNSGSEALPRAMPDSEPEGCHAPALEFDPCKTPPEKATLEQAIEDLASVEFVVFSLELE